MTQRFVRTPASSANLGAGFDVLGMALDMYADIGVGEAPPDARQLDDHHPARHAFAALGGTGTLWMRSSIPMARGLGFSGAVRVGAAALGAVQNASDSATAIATSADEILRVAAELEGHGDNVAASLIGGVTAFVQGMAVPISIGPVLAASAFVAWIPDVRTSTDKSRRALDPSVHRIDAVHNLGRAIQFVSAFAHDDPAMLRGATDDRLHQAHRLPMVPGAADALEAGVSAGAWCGWLSGSGPTVGFLCDASTAAAVAEVLPAGGHSKVLSLDVLGARLIEHPKL